MRLLKSDCLALTGQDTIPYVPIKDECKVGQLVKLMSYKEKLSCSTGLSGCTFMQDGLMADRTEFGKFTPTGLHGFGTRSLTAAETFKGGK